MVTMLRRWLLVLMAMFWISVSDFMQMLYSVDDHMVLRFIFWVPDLFTWRSVRAFDLGIPSMFREDSTISDSRSIDPVQWEIYMVLGSYMCGSYVGPLTWWYSNDSEQCNNHVQEWWNLDPIWSHVFAYIAWLTTCLTYMFYYFQWIIFASLVLNLSIFYLLKINIKTGKSLGNDRTWHGIHSFTPCIFMHS